jgi:hypothetical protein
MGGPCSKYRRDKKCIKILIGKPHRKRLLGSPRCRGKNNTDLKEIG